MPPKTETSTKFKSYNQLNKYFDEGVHSVKQYGYDYKKDTNLRALANFLDEYKNKIPPKEALTDANHKYEAFRNSKEAFIYPIKQAEKNEKRRGKQPIASNSTYKDNDEDNAEPQEGDFFDTCKNTVSRKMTILPPSNPVELPDDIEEKEKYIRNIIRKNPQLKKEIRRELTKLLVEGNIDFGEYQYMLNESGKEDTLQAKIDAVPELKGQLQSMADKEYLEGNIDKEKYEKLKSMSVQKVAAVSSERVPFSTPINYKQKINTIIRS